MRYEVTGEFVKISETAGTIQNVSNVYPVEISDKAEAGSGILLYPLNRISVTLSECYLRCVDGGNAEVRVVPFEVDVTRGGGSSAAGTSNLTDVFRSLEVIDGKVNFYGTTDKSSDILDSFNLPEEIFLNQVGTIVVHDFMFSALAYPNSTDPQLNGKTVLVLAVKGDKKTNPTIKYVFVDLQKLVDKYLASNKSININGYSIAVNISDDTKNLLALKEDGLFVGSDDSKLDKIPSAVQDNIPVFDVDGTIIDGGLSFADLEYELPTASGTTKGGVKVGNGLAMDGETLNVTISGGESYSDFTGATSIAGGLSGLVPAPAAGDEEKFLRGDGTWSTVSGGGGSSTELILPTVPATIDGGLWYELTDNKPMLWLRQNGYGYGFNFDTIRFVGTMDDALAAYLKFDGSTTADICGNTWTATGDVSLSTEIKKFGMSSVHLPNKAYLSADNIFNVNAEKWTFDAWCYLVSGDGNTGIVALGVKTAYEERTAGVQLLCSGIYVSNESSPTSWQKQYNPMPNISNQWVHIAVVKDGTSLTFYQNGTQFWTYTLTANLYAGDKFYLGYSPSWGDSLDIYFDNVRFFEGVALWNSDFTPPTADSYA